MGNYFQRLLGTGVFTSWYDARIGGTFGVDATDMAEERDAAQKTAVHAGTPGVEHFDSGGNTCLSVIDLGVNGRQPTRTVHDIEGSQLTTIDPLGRRAIEYVIREPLGGGFQYVDGRDLTGRELFHNSMDGTFVGRPLACRSSSLRSQSSADSPLRRDLRGARAPRLAHSLRRRDAAEQSLQSDLPPL